MRVDAKAELMRAEDERWADFREVLSRIPEAGMQAPGLTQEWSVKDLLAHLGCWMAEAARILERIRLGTYEREKLDIESRNTEFYEAWKDADLQSVKAECESARTRMLQEWGALAEVTPAAEEWFRDSGPGHIDEHFEDLRRFADEVAPPGGPPQ